MSENEQDNNKRPGEEELRPTASFSDLVLGPGSQIGPFRIERELGRGGKGCVVFFASGNENDSLRWPGRYPEVIAVGATNHNDLRWWYSNYGPELDLVAPSGGFSDEDWWATMGKDWLLTTDIIGIAGYSEWNREYGIDPEMLDYTFEGGTSRQASSPIL